MLDVAPLRKEAVYLLADHLDAALAAGEDLLASRLPAPADTDPEGDAVDALGLFVGRLRRHEAALVGRVLQARRCMADFPAQADMRPVARLFVANTDPLLDCIERLGDRAQARFETGSDRMPFLRERGLLAKDAAGLPPYAAIDVSEAYKIAGVIELGPLLDMIASFLDLLDRRYDLYRQPADNSATLASAPGEAAPGRAEAGCSAAQVDGMSGLRKIGGGAPHPTWDADHASPVATVTAATLIAAIEQLQRAGEGAKPNVSMVTPSCQN